MSSFMHPQDGPTPICPGAPSSQTNNPTWFAFTAWCSELTLRARPSNCEYVQFVVGLQIAIYEDCSFKTEVACDVDIQDCNASTKVLIMTGLKIGGVYYFMVDGCLGSYCTVTIDVVGVCGEEVIAPWTMPVIGEMHPCIGDTETYIVEDLDGAGTFHWFLDGVLVGQTPIPRFDRTWTVPGTYELCIDASNDPCVPLTDAPSPLCVTIVVHESDAGMLSVSASSLCLNELVTFSSTGFSAGIDNTQIILVTDESGNIVNVINAPAGVFTSGVSGTFTIYAYNYSTPEGAVPVIGMNIDELDCGSECCDLVSQTITFQNISAEVSNIVCHNNGTDDDPLDDTFTFDVLVTGPTPGTAWRSSDGTLDGVYGTIRNCGPYLIIGGWLDFDLHDYNIPTCSTSITVIPPPVCSVCTQLMDAGISSTIDCIHTTATLAGVTSATGVYTWTGPDSFISNSLTTTVSDSGWYHLTVEFANQCTFSDSVYIDMDTTAPVADAGLDQMIECNQLQVFIDGSSSSGQNLQYKWTDVSGAVLSSLPGLLVSTDDLYILQVTNAINGCHDSDSVEVMLNANVPEEIFADVLHENCLGETNGVIDVTGIAGGMPPFSYTLNGLVTNTTGLFSNLGPGGYTLQITDGDGCKLDTFFTINQGIDLQVELPPVIELIVGHSGSIEANVNVPAEDLSSIQWTPEGLLTCDTCLTTAINELGNYTLQLTVVHQVGCVATAQLNIIVVPETEIYIPNVFSPNGDDYNDFFTLYANERVELVTKLSVYDRWGELVFQRQQFDPNDESAGWDGTFRGKELMPSIYVYSLEVLLANGEKEILSGNVTLVR